MADQLPVHEEETAEGLVASWIPARLFEDFAWQTSLPDETLDERRKILAIIEGEEIKGQTIIGSTLYVSHYVCHPINLRIKNTEEFATGVRTILPQPEGPPVSFTALGILQSLKRIAHTERRTLPFDPPMKVLLKQVGTSGARRTYKLIPVSE